MRDSFVFYKSFYDAIEKLPEEYQLEFIKALMDYNFKNEQKEMSPIVEAMFLLVKTNIDKANQRYEASVENGKKGGRPKTKTKPKQNLKKPNNNLTKPNNNLNEPKQNLNVYDNDNVYVYDNVNVNDKENVKENENAKEKTTTPPTLTEIQVYINANKLNVDAEKFYNYYKAINWRGVENWRQKLLKWSNTEKAESRNVKDANKYYDTVNPAQYKNLERFCCI